MQKNYHVNNNTIWSFFKGSDGTLWVGTDAGLLRKPKNSNRFSQIKVQGIVDKKQAVEFANAFNERQICLISL